MRCVVWNFNPGNVEVEFPPQLFKQRTAKAVCIYPTPNTHNHCLPHTVQGSCLAGVGQRQCRNVAASIWILRLECMLTAVPRGQIKALMHGQRKWIWNMKAPKFFSFSSGVINVSPLLHGVVYHFVFSRIGLCWKNQRCLKMQLKYLESTVLYICNVFSKCF